MTTNRAPAEHIAHRVELEILQHIFGDDETGGGGIVLLAGIAGSDGAVFHDRPQLAELFHINIGSDAFILVEHNIVAAALRHGDGDDLVGERAIFPGCCCPLLAAEGICVGFLTRNLIFGGEVFGRFDHAGNFAKPVDGLGAFATRDPVDHAV